MIKINESAYLVSCILGGMMLIFTSLHIPLLGGMLLLLVSAIRPSRSFLLMGLALVLFHFIEMNLNKTIENDLYWYSEQFLDNYTAPLSDVFNDVRFGVLARASEPVYHVFSYVLSNITGANFDIYVVVVTILIYALPLKGIFIFSRWAKLKERELITLLIFMLFFGIIFTQTLHLIRQYLACVFLFVGAINLAIGRSHLALAMFLISCLTHNSMVVLVVLFVSCSYLYKTKLSPVKMLIASTFLGGGLAAVYIFYFLFFMADGANRLSIDDGSVGFLVKTIDALILILSFKIIMANHQRYIHILPLYVLYLAYCSFLIVSHYSVFLSLRYYFVLDFFRWIGFFIIISSLLLNKNRHAFLNISLVFLGCVYLWLRVASSPFDFKYSVYEYFTGAASMFY
jgi:hypothetical protein